MAKESILTYEIATLHGGVAFTTDPEKVAEGKFYEMNNLVLDEVGMANKRNGCLVLNAGVGAANVRAISGYVFKRPSAADLMLAHFNDGTLRSSTDGITWTTFKSGVSIANPMSWCTYLNKVWWANGSDDLGSYDGTTVTTFPTAPKFKYIAAWKDGLWGANGGSANPDRMYSSDSLGTTWPALNFVDIAKGSGRGISGIHTDAISLVVHKFHETWAIYDPVEYTNRLVDPSKGAVSHWSIVNRNGVIYFIAHEGICQYLGDAPSKVLSAAIQPIFSGEEIDDRTFYWGYTWQDRVGWCYFPNVLVEDCTQVEYYPEWPDEPLSFHTMPMRIIINSLEFSGGSSKLVGFGDASNKVFKAYDEATLTDDGVSFVANLKTGWGDFVAGNSSAPDIYKYLYRILAYARGDFTIKVYTDFDDTAPVFTTDNDQSGGLLGEVDIPTDIYCRRIRVEITDNVNAAEAATSRTYKAGANSYNEVFGRWGFSRLIAFARPCGDAR